MNWQKVINKGIDTLVHILLDIEMIQDENDFLLILDDVPTLGHSVHSDQSDMTHSPTQASRHGCSSWGFTCPAQFSSLVIPVVSPLMLTVTQLTTRF